MLCYIHMMKEYFIHIDIMKEIFTYRIIAFMLTFYTFMLTPLSLTWKTGA